MSSTKRIELENRVEWRNEAGNLHRADGPAIEHIDGSKEWFRNGKRHREDGPAVECANGVKRWYLNGKCLSEEEFKEELKKVSSSLFYKNESALLPRMQDAIGTTSTGDDLHLRPGTGTSTDSKPELLSENQEVGLRVASSKLSQLVHGMVLFFL